jgi:hypothetical protein
LRASIVVPEALASCCCQNRFGMPKPLILCHTVYRCSGIPQSGTLYLADYTALPGYQVILYHRKETSTLARIVVCTLPCLRIIKTPGVRAAVRYAKAGDTLAYAISSQRDTVMSSRSSRRSYRSFDRPVHSIAP